MRKRRADEKLEADVQKQQCLEEKWQDKAFEQAMIESPIGGICEAQAAAELESLLFQNNELAHRIRYWWSIWLEGLKPEFFIVAPEDRSENYQHQIPQLKMKARRKSGRRPGTGSAGSSP